MTWTAVDLFCGAGGFSAGLTAAGIEVLAALDAWEPAVESYALNFEHPVVRADISKMTVAEFRDVAGIGISRPDLVVGGPPCQGFSIQRIGADEDHRNDLVFEFARYVLELRPRLFFMENVPGLLGSRGKAQVEGFERVMREGGYVLSVQRVNAAEFGVPQTRKRVIFYGWPREEPVPFHFPKPPLGDGGFLTVWDAISDLPSPPEDGKPMPGDPLHRRFRMSALNRERLEHIPPGGGFEHLPVELRVDCHKGGADRIGHRNVYGRLAPGEPAGTITARFDSFTRGKFAHPFEHRNITLREGARLQTFPDSYQFRGTQEQIATLIGNAVPVRLAEHLGRAAMKYLSGDIDIIDADSPSCDDETRQFEFGFVASNR